MSRLRFLVVAMGVVAVLAVLAQGATQAPVVVAAESLIEELTVNSAQASPTFSTSLLEVGVSYRVEGSGFHLFNMPCCPSRQADAEYTTEDSWQTFGNPGTPSANDLAIVYGSSIGTPVFNSSQNITAQDVDWGPFDPNHVYSLNVLGDGGNIGFVVSDFWGGGAGGCSNQGCVFDNSGSLTVKIFEVEPPPSVGGIAEVVVGGGEAAAGSAEGSGPSAGAYAAIAGAAAAAVIALAAGGWYVRRRIVR